MPMVYWFLVGLVIGAITGRLIPFHTIHWGTPIDAAIGVVAAVLGAATMRGFGVGSVGTDWRNILVAAFSAFAATCLFNHLARFREEEVDARAYNPMSEPRVADTVRDITDEDTAA